MKSTGENDIKAAVSASVQDMRTVISVSWENLQSFYQRQNLENYQAKSKESFTETDVQREVIQDLSAYSVASEKTIVSEEPPATPKHIMDSMVVNPPKPKPKKKRQK